MSTVEERHKRRVLRGRILRSARKLWGQKPNTLMIDSLHRGVDKYEYGLRDVQEEVAYLVSKNYLQEVKRLGDALDKVGFMAYCLTGHGWSLLNGDFPDESIEVEES